jgi:hypothetical protein
MPAIINSAPDCVTHVEGAKPADDISDFILQANYQDCGGIMTFGPGTTWGDGGASAATSYYVLTWVGIAVMVIVFVAWVMYENRRLLAYAAGKVVDMGPGGSPPQPGIDTREVIE